MSDAYVGDGAKSVEPRYRVAGEGRDLFSRADLRERIRQGLLDASSEIAREDSEDYQAAGSFPELQRYFSLVSSQEAVASTSSLVQPGHSAPPASVLSRLVPGALYPLTGFGSAFVILFAMLELIPVMSLISAVAIPLFSVAIIRVSSEGGTRMPSPAAFGSLVQILATILKIFVLTLLSAWPFILALVLAFLAPRSAFGLGIMATVVMLLYYPACLAILARFNTIRPALSVSQVWAFITALGSDYAVALGASFAVVGVAFVAGVGAAMIGLPQRVQALVFMIPIVWGTFYVAHLIGWAMYNRRNAL